VRISYAQKRLGAVFADSKEERDARLALAAVHPAVRQTINPHATLSIAAQTIRPVDCTPHHHLLCYRPAASMPQVLVRGMDLLARLTWRHDLHTREEPARPRDKHGPSGHNLNIPINPTMARSPYSSRVTSPFRPRPTLVPQLYPAVTGQNWGTSSPVGPGRRWI
jgi:hypothetical protein